MIHNQMENYIRVMSEPVISRRQSASLVFIDQNELDEALQVIEQAGLKAHVHLEEQGVASVYLYLDNHLVNTLRDLSTIGFDRPEYYQEVSQVLGIQPEVVSQWASHHPARYQ